MKRALIVFATAFAFALVVGLIVFPWLMILIYLIARGRGMAERQAAAVRGARESTDEYIQSVASRVAPAQ